MLLARHRKSVFGKGFIGELGSENLATHRNSTLIEVLIATSLYYLRSYYPNLPHLSNDDIVANREVKTQKTMSLFFIKLCTQLFRSSHIFVFWFLVFWSLKMRDFLSAFFRLAHVALQNVNKDYVIFS